MLELVAAKWATHLAWLFYPHFVAAHVAFHLANKQKGRQVVVSHDGEAYVKQQADQAERLQRTGHVSA